MKTKLIYSSTTSFTIITLLLIVVSCNSNKQKTKTTESGLQYQFIVSNEGQKPSIGDVLNMRIVYATPSDSILYDSKSYNDSFSVVLVKPTFIGGVEEGFAMMSPGDSAHFIVSADSLFEKTFMGSLPLYLKNGDKIFFKVKLHSFKTKALVDSVNSAKDIAMRRMEFAMLDTFLVNNKMDVMPTRNGAYLSIIKPGKGPNPKDGDTVFVEYTGRLLDGTVFDKSVGKTPPFSFVLGNKMVIEGWEECIPYLNKGAEARMVLPSDLAYGGDTLGLLPGYSSLVFDVKILDIK